MTGYPVLPPLLLAILAVAILVARVITLRRLLAAGPNPTAFWRWAGVTVAAVLLIIATTRPVIGADGAGAARIAGDTEPSIFLVVDRSPEMAVPDLANRVRIDIAKDDLTALVDRYPNARFAVIEFASRARLAWPLSADTWSLRPEIAAITPLAADPDGVAETNVGAAGNVLRYQLIGATQQYPRAHNLVFYLGPGATEAESAPRKFEPPEGAIDGGAVLGYGAAADGIEALRDVAAQLGVPLVPRVDAAPLDSALPDTGAAGGTASARVLADGRTETYWLPAGIAAVLILVELYRTLRGLRHTRRTSEVML